MSEHREVYLEQADDSQDQEHSSPGRLSEGRRSADGLRKRPKKGVVEGQRTAERPSRYNKSSFPPKSAQDYNDHEDDHNPPKDNNEEEKEAFTGNDDNVK